MSQFFTSGGQSIGASASASVLPMNIQDWFPLGFTSLISLQSMGLSRVFSNITTQKHQFFRAQISLRLIKHIHRWTFVSKVMSLLFNMLSRFVIAFLLMSKCLLISWLQSPFAVIVESKKMNCCRCFFIYLPWSEGPDAMILVFWMLSFKPTFLLSFLFHQKVL